MNPTFSPPSANPRALSPAAPAFRYIAIPSHVAEAVRTSLTAPRYGHPASLEVAPGYGPCRHCLRTFDVGRERRVLFPYDPFDRLEPLPLPGPVFIHADDSVRHAEDGAFPEELRAHRLTLNAYGRG